MLTELKTKNKQHSIWEKNPANFAIYLLLFTDKIFPFVGKKDSQNFMEKLSPQLY